MTHYSDDVASVRVDFFRDSGKWYTTEAVIWPRQMWDKKTHILDAFSFALVSHLLKDGKLRLAGMWAVCLDPYHELSYPLMLQIDEDMLIAYKTPP